jgi:hypothetical protein
MAAMLALGKAGIADLIAKQKVAIAAADRVERTALEDLASAFGKK